MSALFQLDWRELFVPTLSIGEIILRGSVVYLFIFFVFRVLRREAGAIGISDLLVVVLIADAVQNAMGSDYKSITEGLILVLTIVFWDMLLNWLDYRIPALRPLLRPAPLPLIRDGRLQRRNMRRELITEEELMAKLREQGLERVEDVKASFLEGEGNISVVPKDAGKGSQGKSQKKVL